MKRATPKARYRVEFKVRAMAALDANEGKIYRTARLLGVPRTTLRDWNKQRDDIHLELEKQQKQRGLMLEDRFEAAIDQIVNLLPEKIEAMKPLESIHALKLMMSLKEETAAKNKPQVTREDVHAKLIRLLDQYAGETEGMAEESTVNRPTTLLNS